MFFFLFFLVLFTSLHYLFVLSFVRAGFHSSSVHLLDTQAQLRCYLNEVDQAMEIMKSLNLASQLSTVGSAFSCGSSVGQLAAKTKVGAAVGYPFQIVFGVESIKLGSLSNSLVAAEIAEVANLKKEALTCMQAAGSGSYSTQKCPDYGLLNSEMDFINNQLAGLAYSASTTPVPCSGVTNLISMKFPSVNNIPTIPFKQSLDFAACKRLNFIFDFDFLCLVDSLVFAVFQWLVVTLILVPTKVCQSFFSLQRQF